MSTPHPNAKFTLAAALSLLSMIPEMAQAAPPVRLGTRDGLDVVLFSEPRPQVLRVRHAVVVVLRPDAAVPADLRAGARWLGGRGYLVAAADPLAAAAAWAARPEVLAADPDVLLPRKGHDFDDPGYGGQWYLETLDMEPLYAVSLGDPAVHVGVIDSATDIAHPDLASGILAPYDAVDRDDDPSPDVGDFCPDGVVAVCDEHGTAVSGIIGARANNGTGIVGLCPTCTLVPIRLISDGETPISADVQAFEHAIAQDVAVINNSWGFTEATTVPRTLAAVIHRAATETRGGLGALVVFAAGNDDRTLEDDEVTGLEDVLCVSAADRYGRPTAYTNRGASVDVCAPSATVTLAPGGGTTTTFGGTSAAAPVVSGLAAWAFSVAPEMSAAEMHALLVETAAQSPLITPDEDGHHDVYGWGIVSPPALLARLRPPPPDAGIPDAAPPPVDAGVSDGAQAPGSMPDAAEPPTPAVPELPEADGMDAGGGEPAEGGGGGGGGCQAAGAPGSVPTGLTGLGALACAVAAGSRRRLRKATPKTAAKTRTPAGR